jgi:hypothetical protein
MHRRPRSAFVLGLALSAAACAGDGPAPLDSTSWFARLQQGVFDQSCTTAGCHNPQAAAAGLILTAGASFDALVGVEPSTPAAAQAGLLRVQPFDPEGSFLLIKVLEPGPGQGSRMPQGADPLSADQIQTIRDWIEAGAPQFDDATPPTGTPSPTDVPAPPTQTPPPASPTATAAETAVATTTAQADTPTPTDPTPTDTPAEPTPLPTVTLEQVQEAVLSPRCAVQFCHSGDFPAAQLNLEEGESFDELLNVVPITLAAANAGLLLVDPGDAENSFLYVKITNPTPQQGFRMPLTGDPLTEQEIALVRAWIEGL